MDDNGLLAEIHCELMAQGKAIGRLEGSMKTLVGNGEPGRIGKIENDVEDLKAAKNQAMGVSAAFATLVTSWELIKHFFKVS